MPPKKKTKPKAEAPVLTRAQLEAYVRDLETERDRLLTENGKMQRALDHLKPADTDRSVVVWVRLEVSTTADAFERVDRALDAGEVQGLLNGDDAQVTSAESYDAGGALAQAMRDVG